MTYVALNALEILTPCIDIIDIHSIEHITLFNASMLFRIENWLNIKKVMGRSVWMCFASTVSTYIAYIAFQISNT